MGKKADMDENLQAKKETVLLCGQHVDELDNLEKRRFLDQTNVDRVDLLSGAGQTGLGIKSGAPRVYGTGLGIAANAGSDRQALFEGASGITFYFFGLRPLK